MMGKRKVALIGANGFVGSAIGEALEKMQSIECMKVTRQNYEQARANTYDLLINAAMPSKRFWAKHNPEKDFIETVQKTADLFYKWSYSKFVQISTVSVRCEPHTVYGRHKAAAEKICEAGDYLIVRLTSMYGERLDKGVLIDILNQQKVFVSGESRYAFTPVGFVGSWIARHLDRTGIVEIGAKNSLSLKEIADHLAVTIAFEGPKDCQEIQMPEPDFPDVRDVLTFLDRMKRIKIS